MKALDVPFTAEIVTVLVERKWQALVVDLEDLEILYGSEDSFDTVERALEILLEYLSDCLFLRMGSLVK
jgi:uncharacterized protein related to proFAR isomerase